ncbi:MAG TPA: PQQ-binding-like beta-propeller repeat protein [Vicinamibacterales bacterium]|nr:PQQ-binding-like beta-propeller repeat protein [Vicinamibacterales bacterium]
MRLTPVLLSLAVAVTRVSAEDWPQFRGPTGQGHATERGLPLEWGESRNILWKTPVPGFGWSSPVVAGGKVWLTTVVETKEKRDRVSASLRALAFDVETGKELVNVEVFQIKDAGVINPKNSRASPTPIIDGDRVYVHFGADGTAALSTSGQILWTARLPYESQHGNGGSPIVYRDLLIVNCDGNGGEAYVAALDTATGKIRWKTPRRKPADQAYSTPLVITVGDRDEVVSAGAYRAAAYDPLTGQEIWRVSYGDGFSNVPRPVFGNGLVYIATGFQTPSLIAVRPEGKGDVTRTNVAWTITRGAPYTPSPLLIGEDFYYVSDTGVLSLADASTGKIAWQQRLGGNYSASPVFADGRIYFQSEEGETTVIAPGKEFKKLAVNRLDGYTLASMAVSGGSLFIRSHSHLYRIGERH